MSRVIFGLTIALCVALPLGARGDDKSVDELVKTVKEGNAEAQDAISALGRLAPKAAAARAALRDCLNDSDLIIRLCAVRAWGSSGGDLQALVPLLADDRDFSDQSIRESAIEWLIQSDLHRPRAVESLIKLGYGSELLVSLSSTLANDVAAELLVLLGKWEGEIPYKLSSAIQTVGPLSAPHVPKLLELAGGTQDTVSIAALEVLRRMGPAATSALPQLRALLESPKWNIRLAAAGTLGAIEPRDDAFMPVLLRGLADRKVNVRAAAARRLAKVARPVPGLVSALIAALQDTSAESRNVRGFASAALVHIGKAALPELAIALQKDRALLLDDHFVWIWNALAPVPSIDDVLNLLTNALRDPDAATRKRAATVLGKFESIPEPARIGLRSALGDTSPGVRLEAADALVQRGEPAVTVVPSLVSFLTDEDSNSCWTALLILQKLEAAAAPAIPELVRALALTGGVSAGFGGNSNAPQAARALTRIGIRAIPALINALDDKNPQVRGLAAEALGDIGPAAAPAVPALMARLADQGKYAISCGCVGMEPTVAESVTTSLGKIGPAAKAAIPQLLRLFREQFSDPDAALFENYQPCLTCLAKIGAGDRALIAALEELLEQESAKQHGMVFPLEIALLQVDVESAKTPARIRHALEVFVSHFATNPYVCGDSFVIVVDVMVALGERGAEFQPVLREFFRTRPILHMRYRCIAAATLLRINPEEPGALEYLQRLASSEDMLVSMWGREGLDKRRRPDLKR